MAVTIIDFEDDGWQSHISGDWIVTDEGDVPAYEGDRTLRSPPMSETGEAISRLSLAGIVGKNEWATITLSFRRSSYGNHNTFYINDVITGGYDDEVGWTTITIDQEFDDGGDVEFRFHRNINLIKGEDAAFIDQIEITTYTTDVKLFDNSDIYLIDDFGGVPNPTAINNDGTTSVMGAFVGSAARAADFMFGSGSGTDAEGQYPLPSRRGTIAGTVLDIQAQPISRRVRVHERTTGRIAREGWSDADGKYRFTDLDPRRAFYVMAFDHTLQQNAVVSDNVHPELEDTP